MHPNLPARCRLAAAVAALAVWAWPGAAEQQPVQPPEGATGLAAYLALVDAYRAGDVSGPRLALSSWTDAQLESVESVLLATPDPAARFPALDRDRALAAAFLHTEVAFGSLSRGGLGRARAHLLTARDILELYTGPELAAVRREWRLVVGCRLRGEFLTSDARQFLESAEELDPPDPATWIALGSIHERHSNHKNIVCPTRETCPGSDARTAYERMEGERDRRLREALRCYERALELDPNHVEAQIRSGRILSRMGRHADAGRRLESAILVADNPRLAYLAHLFQGQNLEWSGDAKEAISEYRAAVDALPRAPVGRTALALALRRRGDRAGERDTMASQLAGEEAQRPDALDPWWIYATRPEVCRENRWPRLRREALR